MIGDDISSKLKQLDIEDYIWVIYIGIIILSWYSNALERNYFLYNDLDSKAQYREIIKLIFFVLVIVYFYFLVSSFNDVINLECDVSNKKKELVYLSFLGSLLIFISGVIFLYIAIVDEDIDVELAFN